MQKIFIIALLAIGLGACSREGDFQEKASFMQMEARSFSLAPDTRFVIIVNNNLISDSLVSEQAARALLKTTSDTQRVQVKDYKSGQLLYDTLISTPGTSFNITILQLDASGTRKPQFISGGQEEDIPGNHVLLSLYYDSPTLPDSMAVTIYCLKQDPETYTYAGIDTLVDFAVVRKGQLTDFQLMDFSLDPYMNAYVFEPKDVITGETLPGGEIDAPNFEGPQLGGGPTTDKHIICSIRGIPRGGVHVFRGSRLISY